MHFNTAFRATMRHEGGYANDPDDKGGETYMGISRKHHPKWKGWQEIDRLKNTGNKKPEIDNNKNLVPEVEEFYKKNYWDSIKLSKIASRDVAEELFDTAVNQGKTAAIKYLQRSLNVLNNNEKKYKDLEVDGKMGPKTIEAANSYMFPKILVKCINGLQFMRYYNLAQKDKTQEKFMLGWLKRV